VRDYRYYSYTQSRNYRRLQNDLIWCYKIVFGHTITYSDFFKFRLSNTRGHPYKLFKRRCSNATRSVFFSERVINIWNSLPCDVTNFSSVKAFKRTCDMASAVALFRRPYVFVCSYMFEFFLYFSVFYTLGQC